MSIKIKNEISVVRHLTIGPTGHVKPARESNPESPDCCYSRSFVGVAFVIYIINTNTILLRAMNSKVVLVPVPGIQLL